MGAHSTLNVRREAAIAKIQKTNWEGQTNNRLELILDCLFDERLYNFRITDGYPPDVGDDSSRLMSLYIDPIRETTPVID